MPLQASELAREHHLRQHCGCGYTWQPSDETLMCNQSPLIGPEQGSAAKCNYAVVTQGQPLHHPTRHSPNGAAVPPKAGLTGAGVKPSMTHGAAPQTSPCEFSIMVLGQQSDAPLVPGTAPQPSPPHMPHSSLQHTVFPSSTPGVPSAQVDGPVTNCHKSWTISVQQKGWFTEAKSPVLAGETATSVHMVRCVCFTLSEESLQLQTQT